LQESTQDDAHIDIQKKILGADELKVCEPMARVITYSLTLAIQ
jgi:hypothetical protein